MSPRLVSRGTQTVETSFQQPSLDYFIHPESSSEDESDDNADSDYDEIYDICDPCDAEMEDEEDNTVIQHKYVFVEWSKLKSLFTHCLSCGQEAVVNDVSRKGSMLKVCIEGNIHTCEWTSQSSKRHIPEANMAICAGILLSGMTYNGFRRAMDITDVMCISERIFYEVQKMYLFPATDHIYEMQKKGIVDEKLQNESLSVAGDEKFDSPGYSAKYGTYTIMNTETKEIIDCFIAHVSNAGSSQGMELYGFKKVLTKLTQSDRLKISTITTDRHRAIRKNIGENCNEIEHQFDIRHFGKNVKKMLSAKSKYVRFRD